MKRLALIWFFALGVALAGCTKIELDSSTQREVTFSVGKYVTETKASSSLNGSEDAITAFKSRGFLHAEGVNATQDFFGAAGETITYSAGTWEPSHPYYWPKSANSYINFVSWYDKKGAPTTVSETALEWVDRTIVADDNILFADEAWRYNNNTTNSTQYTNDNITTGVPTLFHHALTRAQINLKSKYAANPENASETYEVTLHSARIDGIYFSGNMSMTNSDPGANSPRTTRAWSNQNQIYFWTPTGTVTSSESPFSFVSSNTGITTTSQAILNLRSFMPQSLENAILVLNYSITTKRNGVVTLTEDNIPSTINLNLIKNTSGIAITDWLPNRIYTYNLTIDPICQDILIYPTLESNWEVTELSVSVE